MDKDISPLDRKTFTVMFRIADAVMSLSFEQRAIIRLLYETKRRNRPGREQVADLLGLTLKELKEQEEVAMRKLQKALEADAKLSPSRPR